MSRYIILVEREPELVTPLVQDDPGFLTIFNSLVAAREVAVEHILCRAFPYQIIDLDNTDDES